jgi:hypothetical protein
VGQGRIEIDGVAGVENVRGGGDVKFQSLVTAVIVTLAKMWRNMLSRGEELR